MNQPPGELQKLLQHIDEQVQHSGELMESYRKFIDDPQLRDNLKVTMDNLRDTSASAKHISEKLEKFSNDLEKMQADTSSAINEGRETIRKTQGHIDDVSKQLGDRLAQVSTLLDQFQSIATKIDKGQGTAGQLVNDPKLYAGLVDTVRELNLTIQDLKRLVNQWEQEGMTFKLNK